MQVHKRITFDILIICYLGSYHHPYNMLEIYMKVNNHTYTIIKQLT